MRGDRAHAARRSAQAHSEPQRAIAEAMTFRIILPAITALVLTAVALFSFARGAEATAGDVVVAVAWARATPPGATVGAAYVRIENHGEAEDRLVAASSPAAPMVMVHETVEENGVSKMREHEGGIPPGGVLEMKPGGVHIMLMGLGAPLKEGETVALTLTFEKAGTVDVTAKIAPIGAAGPLEGVD